MFKPILNSLKNRRGQGVSIEYAVLFSLVVAVIVGMTVYVKRGVQARVRGARNYAWVNVNGVYNQMYSNRVLPVEYEPYYVKTATGKNEQSIATELVVPWAGHEGKFYTGTDSSVTSMTVSNVASPRYAD